MITDDEVIEQMNKIFDDEFMRQRLYKIGSVKETNFKEIREVVKVRDVTLPSLPDLEMHTGMLVAVRPVEKTYGDKTYIGIFLGQFPHLLFTTYDKNEKAIIVINRLNPAIFVPELKKIIYGFESWWKTIKSIQEFQEITDDDIKNVWYVKLLRKELERVEKRSEKSDDRVSE